MELLANDLSVHEQFHDTATFRDALSRFVAMRQTAQRYGRELYCHRAMLVTSPMPGVSMQQAIAKLAVESERRSVMGWMTRLGPFWDDLRKHESDDWLECDGKIVTDSAVGEAAFRALHGITCGLISVTPSDWDFTPIKVIMRREAEGQDDQTTILQNWRDAGALADELRNCAAPIRSWSDLREVSASRFDGLVFSENCFEALAGVPYAQSGAERFFVLLDILDRLAHAFDEGGARTAEGHSIYQDHFTGDRALFSDSSDSEKQRYRNELTFAHPEDNESSLFCTWHGKVSRLNLRLHFSWPIEAGRPVYVVYAGPKITKR